VVFYDHVVDTSSGLYPDFPSVPTAFIVTNLTKQKKVPFVFYDADNNGQLSNFDEIDILESDSAGPPFLTWGLSFTGVTGQFTLPQPGDEFVFKTLRPLTSEDIFEMHFTSIGEEQRVDRFTLEQNFPNPFNPATMIRYQLPAMREVHLVVYDILGREIQTLVNQRQTTGTYTVTFNASSLATGVYFYRLTAGNFVQTRKLLLLR
jgi:hypothetical protein